MSSPQPETPNEVNDPGEMNQRDQIRHLNDARSDVRKVRNRVSEMLVTGQISRRKAYTAYRQVVTSYILQLAPYLRSGQFGGADADKDSLWNNRDIGKVEISAPTNDGLERIVYEKSLEGVRDLLVMPTPIQVSYPDNAKDELEGDTNETKTTVGEIDMTTLDGIVIELDEFRVDIGLGLKLPEEVGDESSDAF